MIPFDVADLNKLYCISSGAFARTEIQVSILTAEAVGKRAKEDFIKVRLEKNEKFFEPIKKQGLKTLADMCVKAQVKTSKNRIIEYKQQGNVAFQLLVLSQSQDEKIDLREMMGYPMMPVPSSLGTPDGFLGKTDKSKGFHHLTKGVKDSSLPSIATTLHIEDGNATFYCMKEVPTNFRQISQKIFHMTTSGKLNVVFSTDMYKGNSVKSMERKSRGCGEKRIVKGENTKRPENWKNFLTNDENKQQLSKMILQVWGGGDFSEKLKNKRVIAVCEGRAYQLMSVDEDVTTSEIVSLQSDQAETDTRVVLYCKYAEQQKYKSVCVRSPDSDIFFILLHYACNLNVPVLFDTGAGKNRRLLDVSKLAQDFTPHYSDSLLGLHAFTRCDTTSAFKGIGKVKPIKILQKNPRFQKVFCQLGHTWDVPEDLHMGLEQFTCLMYRLTAIIEVDELRFAMLTEKCGADKLNPKNIDLSTFPPPRMCLREHIKRVNYQVGIWKRAHIAKPDIPLPTDDNGWILQGGVLEPKWCDGDFLPQQMTDILEKKQDVEQELDDMSSEEENSSDCADSADEDYMDSSSDSD